MITTERARWQRVAVLLALMLAAFTFNTAENLPVGLLELISDSLRVSVPAVGLLVTGYGVPVALLAVLGLVSLVTIAVLLPTSRPEEDRAAYGTSPNARRFRTVLAAGTLSATGAFAGFTYIVKFLGDVSGFSPGMVSLLLAVFGVACLAGVTVTGILLDRFPQGALIAAVAVQAVGLLGLHATGSSPVSAVLFLALMGAALGPVFMTTQNAMLHYAPGRTDVALAANSGAYNAGIAAGAALGGLVVALADVRGAFLLGGLLSVAACTVLVAGRLLPGRDRLVSSDR